jgi:IS5 family transposase
LVNDKPPLTETPEASPVRSTITKQTDLFPIPRSKHELARELAEIDQILAAHPEWLEWVHHDLTKEQGVSCRRGRGGMTASRVLRVVFLKHRLNVSLRRLALLLPDSVSLRDFLGLSPTEEAPKRSTLQDNVAKIQPETWGRILQTLAQSEEAREHENGEKVRIDCSVVETNIHHPTDSSLLWDSLRSLTRLLKRVQHGYGISFTDVIRRARKLRKKMNFARRQAQRVPVYRKLLVIMDEVQAEVDGALKQLRRRRSQKDRARRQALIADLEQQRDLALRVADQTRRRVLQGENVPAEEKVLSIYEPHTDLVIKRRSKPEYGHKVTFTVGASGMVLDCVIERGNPADATLTTRQLKRHVELMGKAPRSSALDGGFASIDNLAEAKALGVERCAFSTVSYLSPEEMAGSRRTYGRLKNFRAGVEGIISDLKRTYGLRRCTWKGWRRFLSYVWSSVLAFNLTKLARLRLGT